MPLPALALSKAVPRRVDVLVVGIDESGLRGVPDAQDAAYAKRFGMSIAEMAESVGAKPAAGSRRTLPAAGDGPRVVVVGMGPAVEPTPEDLRRAAGAGVRQAASMASGPISVAVALGTSSTAEASAVAEGALLGSYRFAPISTAAAGGGIDRDDHRGPRGQHPRGRGGRPRPDAGPRRRPGPRLGQHAGQSALSGVVRRPGRGTGEGLGGIGRHPRREGVDAAVDTAACSRSAADRSGRRGWFGSATPRAAPRSIWRWSARASRSTPAGSTSSRPTACTR